MSKFRLGITRNRIGANGNVQHLLLADDSIDIDLPDNEFLASVWLKTEDGLDLMRLPLEIVGR